MDLDQIKALIGVDMDNRISGLKALLDLQRQRLLEFEEQLNDGILVSDQKIDEVTKNISDIKSMINKYISAQENLWEQLDHSGLLEDIIR